MWAFSAEHVEGGGTVVGLDNTDKDGAIVAARLASAVPRTVAFTRRLELTVTRESDGCLVRDLGNAVVCAYSAMATHGVGPGAAEGGPSAGGGEGVWERVTAALRVPEGCSVTGAATLGAHASRVAAAAAAAGGAGEGNPLLNLAGTVVLGSVHRTVL